MSSIPASQLVSVTPEVLAAGGTSLAMNGVVLTQNARVPINPLGSLLSFPTLLAVQSYFGALSTEAAIAAVYFKGFDNSNIKPAAILFSQYPASPVAAYVRGGTFGLTLAQMQALSGSLSVVMDGYTHVIASIDLSIYNSFSAAAAGIGAAFTDPTEASITGSISGTTLTVTASSAAAIAAGQTVSGTGVAAGTIILSQLGGSVGGTGTYLVNNSQTVLSGAMTCVATAPVVTYDSVSGAFVITSGITGVASTAAFATGTLSSSLKLTSAAGAILSQGAVATDPTTFMNAVVNFSTDWATFMTAFNPDASGNANKLLFAEWVDGENDEFVYACWDSDASPTTVVPATSSLGYLLQQADLSGTELIYSPDYSFAAFFCGATASIDWNQRNGRITYAFKGQTGLVPTVTDPTTASNLIANGYNFYGVYATAAQKFQQYQEGTISGPWTWADSYVNQIYFNAQFQLALMLLLTQVKSIPYNPAGYAMIGASLANVIQQGLNFGAWRAGVPLSALQASEVNAAAGVAIDSILSSQGWYLQILPATAAVRQVRGSPPMTFWYMDGESVQKINLASVDVQ